VGPSSLGLRLLRVKLKSRGYFRVARNMTTGGTAFRRGDRLGGGEKGEDYRLIFRVCRGVYPWPALPSPMRREFFILRECVAPSVERAGAVVRTTKQYLLLTDFPAGSRPRATSPSRSRRRNCQAARRIASTSIKSCKSDCAART
jgi:hypothetical protein